ncbi:glycosyltransferase family 39 protein [Acidicapsa acidisoli]|uniref:glycosyltransferase family 39 protein n=1 Tax=Acidicapsa acidisoli TaxID=1615681 RepID=UPI0021DFCA55|nr:glycosyltransferase family 39 protein [Acidicapsa acidisoli]
MNRPIPTRPHSSGLSRGEQLLVLAAAFLASSVAVWWSWSHAAMLLYGDAEAHIHIARRLFDSHRPGITQLGSVWLPLPHLLLVPFISVDSWWRSGFGSMIPSAICYLLACLGLYRLMRKWVSPAAACIALALFAANPNLLYMQTTAMTEPLFLCELIWSVLLLVEWYQSLNAGDGRSGRLLWAVIAVLAAAVYTRYDGWILAFLAWLAMAVCMARRGRLFRWNFILASLALLLAPVGWMAYNAVVFGDWLDFMRGPYSARAIELRTSSSAVDPHPGWHNLWVSLVYFAKDAEMDAAALGWGEIVFLAAAIGAGIAWLRFPTRKPGREAAAHSAWVWTLLLWLPLPFYTYSVSYGSVPIFLPVWKPFSWYNTRYGMEMLPVFAFFFAFAIEAVLAWMEEHKPKYRRAVIIASFVLLAANVAEMLREKPLTYVEAKKNTAARGYYNVTLADALRRLHELDPAGVVLMNTSTFPTIVPNAGLTYRQTINESDKEFWWAALGAPAAHASIVLAFAGDDIDKAVKAHPEHLRVYRRFHSPSKGWDQLDATLYVTDTFPAAELPQPSTAVTGR